MTSDERRDERIEQRSARLAEAKASRLAELRREREQARHAEAVRAGALQTTTAPSTEALVEGFRLAGGKALARLLAELDSAEPIEPERLAKIAGESIRLAELLSGRATQRTEDTTPADPRALAVEVVQRLKALGLDVVPVRAGRRATVEAVLGVGAAGATAGGGASRRNGANGKANGLKP